MAQLFKIPDGKLQDMHGTQISVGVSSVTAGTGITLTGTASDPIINNSGVLSLTAGTAITLSGTASAPVVNNNGVTSLAGTANQITASAGTGAVTLSVPSVFVGPGSVSATTDLTGAGLIITGQADFGGSGPVQILDNAGAGINFVRSGLTNTRFATNTYGTQLAPIAVNWGTAGSAVVAVGASAGNSNIGYMRITCTDADKTANTFLGLTVQSTNSSTASTVVQATVAFATGTSRPVVLQAGFSTATDLDIYIMITGAGTDFQVGDYFDIWWRKYEIVAA